LSRDHVDGGLTVVARAAVVPEQLVRPFSETAQALDENVSMLPVETMEQRMAVQLWTFRNVNSLLSIWGVLARVLATVGLAHNADVRASAGDHKARSNPIRRAVYATALAESAAICWTIA
jgi:hypothetical protein